MTGIEINMVYSRHTPKSRKYKKIESPAKDYNSDISNSVTQSNVDAQPNSDMQSNTNMQNLDEHALPPAEPLASKGKKNPPAFGFLTQLFGSGERAERSEKSLLNIFGHDIYLDDLLLVGLILLLLTDKVEDEILLIVLAYLLLDIF